MHYPVIYSISPIQLRSKIISQVNSFSFMLNKVGGWLDQADHIGKLPGAYSLKLITVLVSYRSY